MTARPTARKAARRTRQETTETSTAKRWNNPAYAGNIHHQLLWRHSVGNQHMTRENRQAVTARVQPADCVSYVSVYRLVIRARYLPFAFSFDDVFALSLPFTFVVTTLVPTVPLLFAFALFFTPLRLTSYGRFFGILFTFTFALLWYF